MQHSNKTKLYLAAGKRLAEIEGAAKDVQLQRGQMDAPIIKMLLDIAPGSGDYIAGKDSVQLAGQAYEKAQIGDYKGALQDTLGSIVAGLGALPAVPYLSMVAFHGTPHKFKPTPKNPLGEFDLSKIGTGEGAQAYGHGIYLAEGKGTAKWYAETLGERVSMPKYKGELLSELKNEKLRDSMRYIAQSQAEGVDSLNTTINTALYDNTRKLKQAEIDLAEALSNDEYKHLVPEFKKDIQDLKEAKEAIVNFDESQFTPNTHLYEVDLPDTEIEKMLDWDKPLSEQSDYVKKQILSDEDMVKKLRNGGLVNESGELVSDVTGEGLYNQLTIRMETDLPVGKKRGQVQQQLASEYLNRRGIKGLKYFDNMSRRKGEGTRNFVLFDPSIAKIIGRE